jgi:23S rRNA-/tRNA-specific pseudouridylate synthase
MGGVGIEESSCHTLEMIPVDLEEEDYSPSDRPFPTAAHDASEEKKVVLEVSLSLAGFRLDQALAALLPDYSRSRLTVMIKEGAVQVDGMQMQPKTKLLGGETITATLTARAEETAFIAEDIRWTSCMKMTPSLSSTSPQGWWCTQAQVIGRELY